MKYVIFLVSWVIFFTIGLAPVAFTQTSTPTPSNDSARLADLQARFQSGLKLENDGKLKEALAVFESIIKDEPSARGSLFNAALVSLTMGDAEKALVSIDKFRVLEPKDPRGLILAIQINQSLHRSVKIEGLRKELFALHELPNIAGLSDSLSYHREIFTGEEEAMVIIDEFFDYHTHLNYLYSAEARDNHGGLARKLMIFLNVDETKSLQAKNPKFAGIEVFDYGEIVNRDGKPFALNVYRQEYEKPGYEAARKWFLETIKKPGTPIDTVQLQ